MKINFKQVREDVCTFGRGVKRVYNVTVTIAEATAWLGLLATAYVVLYQSLKGNLPLTDVQMLIVAFSAIALTLRAAVEMAKYFHEVGELEAGRGKK